MEVKEIVDFRMMQRSTLDSEMQKRAYDLGYVSALNDVAKMLQEIGYDVSELAHGMGVQNSAESQQNRL